MLTSKQHELLLFINDRLGRSGVSPSFDEMREALDLKSKSGVHRLISALEERGFIHRLPNRARALEILKLPEVTAAPSLAAPRRARVRVVEARRRAAPRPRPACGRSAARPTSPRRCARGDSEL